MLLEGKKALVTGARKGIGRGIAATLAGEGADVGVNDIVDDRETRRTAEMVQKAGRKGTVHVGDVSKLGDINRVIDEFVRAHGGIDILINNAIFPDQSRPLFETDEAYWDRMMNLSLKGYFFAAQRAAKEMTKQGRGGRIVSLASVHAYRAWKDWTAYGIAKAGLKRMAMGMAVDLAGTGITVNCIAPGAIRNELTQGEIDPKPYDIEQHPGLKSRVPAQRGGLPSDIANAMVFLCSRMGDYVNGETILVDGGMIASGGEMR
jgi:NAD(P)-dependent dehydrogenase (short-subunit alcohol dehydrogenase family)